MHPSFTRRGTLKDDTKAAREDAALIHLCLRQCRGQAAQTVVVEEC